MGETRATFTITLMPNGKALATGGWHNVQTASSEVYDPNTGSWSPTGLMATPRNRHAATLLRNNKILVTGGDSILFQTSSSEEYDPSTGLWAMSSPLSIGRCNHTSTLLNSGIVLIVGGFTDENSNPISEVESYSQNTKSFNYSGNLSVGRNNHTATLLENGTLLIAGGVSGPDYNRGSPLQSGEVYSYLPNIATQPVSLAINQGRHATFSVASPDGNLSYQWQKDGIDVVGANSASLIVSNTQSSNAGGYTVVITNSMGSVTSNAATLTVIPDADGDGLSDADETDVYHTDPTKADTDGDGLSDFAEVQTYGTNPLLTDTDGDGFTDSYEIQTGKSPTNAADKPLLVAEVRTAIEFSFPSATGKTYRVEGSADLASWSTVEDGIVGTGAGVTRFYSTRNTPSRFFRVAESANP
jgi:hypothetical protein